MVDKKDVEEGKTIAVISYLTFIGWIIAFVMNNEKKSTFAKFHIRQSLMLMLSFLVLWFASMFLLFIPFLGWMIDMVVWVVDVVILIFVIMGLISAINGQEKELPFVGSYAQQMFKGL